MSELENVVLNMSSNRTDAAAALCFVVDNRTKTGTRLGYYHCVNVLTAGTHV